MTPRSAPALPPPRVLEAFGLSGTPEPLHGGQGQSVRVGGAVLKPAGDPDGVAWTAHVMRALQGRPGFRVPRFLPAGGGRYVAGGWAATEFLPGDPGVSGRWSELLAAGRAFHAALREEPRPRHLAQRRHPWAVADRIAWDRVPAQGPECVQRLTCRLQALRIPVSGRPQLIHGDLVGNVLFHPGLAPAVIDFSPYWRPAAYAEAIAVVDRLLYHEVAGDLEDPALTGRAGPQFLLRALIFRLAALGVLAGPSAALPDGEFLRFTRVARSIGDRIAGAERT